MTPDELHLAGTILVRLAACIAVVLIVFAFLILAKALREAAARVSKAIDTHTTAITTEANKNAEWHG